MIRRWRRPHSGAIVRAFESCRKEGRAAFIPFLMGGDPSLEQLPDLLRALAAGGADLIELGLPFSDPIADGPTNQRAASRALAAGVNLSALLRTVAEHREALAVPIVLFTYFNPVHRRGVGTFAEQAASSGIDGVLCVDLPPEEAEEEVVPLLVEHGLDPVFLLSPTSSDERIRAVGRVSRGFVYYVSRTGVTGERSQLPEQLLEDVRRLRRRVRLPVAVGFGISSPEQVAAVGRVAEGVVVGSALVRLVEEHGQDPALPGLVEARVRELASALRSEPTAADRRGRERG